MTQSATTELLICQTGKAGRLTLNRPQALNALTHEISLQAEAQLRLWAEDPSVEVVILDAMGERAFCAGGDIAQIVRAGQQGDFDAGRAFWRDEYRMNLYLSHYPKPIYSFLHGFVMGGGVGFGSHVRHRIVCETSQIAMPECGIGLIPDCGGTYLLARAPGAAGVYLGLTAARMGPGDAIWAGFADHYLPEADWPAFKAALAAHGAAATLPAHSRPDSPLEHDRAEIDQLFAGDDLREIFARCAASQSPRGTAAHAALSRNAPLSLASTLVMLRARPHDLASALEQEFRWTWRAMEHGDFLEGVRAQILDKDRNPHWQHADVSALPAGAVAAMLAPLGADEWRASDYTPVKPTP